MLIVVCVVIALTGSAGCGDSSATNPSDQRLASARREGEEAAREKARIKSLQRQVRNLRKEVHKGDPATVVVTDAGDASPQAAPTASTASRTFHAPSGNVSCEVSADGALCSVASIDETFVFRDGEEARLESGTALPRGTGELAPYGSTISVGSVSCLVPESNEPRGITCSDSDTGHGFEASRIPARQSTY
ncbi:MAG TPA: hypothetical protein VFX35_10860 [Solirubrobacterales bacterium]|nr:hypothetical protein [Solirubrobacterales bacterium]